MILLFNLAYQCVEPLDLLLNILLADLLVFVRSSVILYLVLWTLDLLFWFRLVFFKRLSHAFQVICGIIETHFKGIRFSGNNRILFLQTLNLLGQRLALVALSLRTDLSRFRKLNLLLAGHGFGLLHFLLIPHLLRFLDLNQNLCFWQWVRILSFSF